MALFLKSPARCSSHGADLTFSLQSNKFAQWQDHYLRGAGMEMYTEHFSEAFHGQPFPVAAECVQKRVTNRMNIRI